ncbi:hypothetical protein QBC33DRAFT_555239 [Phialemonium atrogriseum]|uniref:ATPase AAA-type core domain-containing protein n=1 Tax=Phialemonium atrogriseum TaxID=1093897 RepID=A0AAJ0C8T8_9PEZI|nr:uncharacterized protein QBC33DRAFT_555239 [Phialemonium atrogriseum]KAK1772075.1 hypothetical protein QBC33DRAFT_555239 [Phialemonium atrogriseum]
MSYQEHVGTSRKCLAGDIFDNYGYGNEDDEDENCACENIRAGRPSINITGRVIIDAFAYGKFGPGSAIEVKPLKKQGLYTEATDEGVDDEDEDDLGLLTKTLNRQDQTNTFSIFQIISLSSQLPTSPSSPYITCMLVNWALISQADALLRSRLEPSQTARDLSCVMLSSLEYYTGIIFLTTNLPQELDNAFISRLDIHLKYSGLTFDNRRRLWQNLLQLHEDTLFQAGLRVMLSDKDLDDLATWRLNGREIKNSVKNATKWCFIKKMDVTAHALKVGINVTAPLAESEVGGDASQSGSRKRGRVDDEYY